MVCEWHWSFKPRRRIRTICNRRRRWWRKSAIRTWDCASTCSTSLPGRARKATWRICPPTILFHVQLCDLAGHPREFATDGDRVLPGDGDFPLGPIVNRLREIDYAGCVSVELMNPAIWQIPPRQFGEVAITALRKLLGMASMG